MKDTLPGNIVPLSAKYYPCAQIWPPAAKKMVKVNLFIAPVEIFRDVTWKLSVQGGALVFLAEPPGGKTNQQGPPILKVG